MCRSVCIHIHCAYFAPSALLIDDEIIASSSDVQQDGPLGPLLFALPVHDITHSVVTPLSICYLDDVTIDGPSESVINSYRKIVSDLCSIGLEVNTSNTLVIYYCTESRKSVYHSPNDAKIVPIENPEHLGSPLLEGAVRCLFDDKTENVQLAIERLMLIDRRTTLIFCALSLSP